MAAGDDLRSEDLVARLTPWDERAFGFRCAEITRFSFAAGVEATRALGEVEGWARDRDVAYLFGRFPSDRGTRFALEQAGFALVETSLSLESVGLDKLPRIPGAMRVSLERADSESIQEALRIAREEFHHGRFIEDPLVPEGDARLRNENWVRDLYAAGQVQVALMGTRVVGFHVERVDTESRAELVLTGVTGSAPGMAMPTWVAALEELRAKGVRAVTTMISASNIGVLNLYAALGFKVTQAHLGYRKIMDEDVLKVLQEKGEER